MNKINPVVALALDSLLLGALFFGLTDAPALLYFALAFIWVATLLMTLFAVGMLRKIVVLGHSRQEFAAGKPVPLMTLLATGIVQGISPADLKSALQPFAEPRFLWHLAITGCATYLLFASGWQFTAAFYIGSYVTVMALLVLYRVQASKAMDDVLVC